MVWAIIIGYAVVILCVALFQRRLIYVPARLSPAVAESSATQNGFLPWRNKANEIIGWQMPARGSSTGVVLVVHGNAGFAGDRDYLARPIHDAAAVDVFVLEYPGYGARPGSPSKTSFITAAEEAFALLPTGKPRYIVAESLGAGVAAHLAKVHAPEVAGMALFVPYHSLAWVAQRTMPLLPAGLLLRDRFAPAEDLKSYQGPIKIVLAENDEVIPAEAGRRLFESYGGPKDLKVFAQARHNEVAEQSPEWWQGVFAFWQANAARSQK
jgi:alpha-beta hydrolase superfamily lysophospholipase